MVGCLANLYESVENLGDTYFQPTTNKDTLLKPNYSSSLATNVPRLLPTIQYKTTQSIYMCSINTFGCGVVTYTIMDDLTVTPMSTISSITMLNKFNVQQVDALEEKVVD
ncbi:hypothetical protein Gogos_021444, partial [Gossypium gossypioides]|nr:hypothetical protein [Gossypium gossypioides]